MAACEGQSYQVITSSSSFPVPTTFSRTPSFCYTVWKIGQTCRDQTRVTLELTYQNICEDVKIVQKYRACEERYKPEKVKEWNNEKMKEFEKTIVKYTKENIIRVNIFIKEPFALKYLIDQNVSK